MSEILNREVVDHCVFCAKITNGGDDAGPVLDTKDVGTVAFAPLNPVTEGHMLFVPRRHDYHPYNASRAVYAAELYARDAGLASWNVIRNYGIAATQTVPHTHIHLVPRRAGDGLLLPWSPVRTRPCHHAPLP